MSPVRERPLQENGPRAFVLLALTYVLFTAVDSTVKYVGSDMHPFQIAWLRFVGHLILCSLLLYASGNRNFWKTQKPLAQLLRSGFAAGVTIFNFISLQYLPLTIANVIMFTSPLLVTLLAVPLLKERVGWRRTTAIIVGFIGIVVAINPDTQEINQAIILQFLAATCLAFYVIMTRWLARYDSAATQIVYMPVVGSVLLLIPLPSVWVSFSSLPDPTLYVGLLLLLCCAGSFGHWLLAAASSLTSAPVVAACAYQQVIYMAIAGWIIFADVPEMTVLLGAAIVIASGMFIAWREHVLKHRSAAKAAKAAQSSQTMV